MAKKKFDFSGWATRFNVKCADGRTIRNDAFKDCDGEIVPLIWSHDHDSPTNVLGHALLECHPNGVRMFGKFNNTEEGIHAKEAVRNGDVQSLSIWANNLQENKNTGDVFHGIIREVSLVLAGANPGAYIDMPYLSHSEDGSFEAEIGPGWKNVEFEIYHSADDMADKEGETMDEERTVQDVLNEMTDEQQQVLAYLLDEKEREVLESLDEYEEDEDEDGYEDYDEEDEDEYEEDDEDYEESDEEDEEEMKHNAFYDDNYNGYITQEDLGDIIAHAASNKLSLRDVVDAEMEDGILAHGVPSPIPMDGMTGPSQSTVSQTYGVRDLDMLFPEYRSLNNPPEWIKRDTNWVDKILNGVHHTPFSRIKSQYANITEDDARARGYIKGKQKKEEIFTLLKRVTEPQTIYKKQKLDKDDISDITDFDVVAWIKGEMRMMLNEEIARAILVSDGRASDSDDKIKEDRIRPIATDVDLFNIKVNVNVAADATPGVKAKAFIDEVIRARKNYKGSGNPKMFTTADMLTEMLLLEDNIGHKLYKSVAELATALRVSEIVEVEVMEGQTINNRELAAIIVNLQDYNLGADKGGAVSLFDDFDIDYNQYKYLIETRCSGALIKPFSAMTVTIGTSN